MSWTRPRSPAWLVPAALAWLLGGCPVEPLDRPPAPEALGPRGLELYLPAGRVAALGAILLEQLRATDQAELRARLPSLAGTLGGGQASYGLPEQELGLALEVILLTPLDGGLQLSASLAGPEASWALDLLPLEGEARTCALGVHGPARSLELAWQLHADAAGRPVLLPTGQAVLSGEPGVVELAQDCTVLDTGALRAEIGQALEAALQAGLPGLVADLGSAAGGVLGLDAGGAGSVSAGFRFSFLTDGTAAALTGGRLRLGLVGGFEGDRAECVPPGLAPPAPGAGGLAGFADLLPGSGQAYGLALAVPHATLVQGLCAAHRAGLLCRRVDEVPLEGVSLTELLPSLEALGSLNGARVAVWPEAAPELSLEPPGEPGERLPRAVLRLPGVGVDVYADLDGADVRVLGCEAELFLTLVPSLDAEGLRVRLVETRVGNLEIGFALLPDESGPALRQAAAALLGQAAGVLVDGLGPLALPLPAAGRGEVLEAWTEAQAVVIYLEP
ncbi:MAG TPA: hypothetical protein PK668_21265 [Myxococcota bacterium]|nr:hypothetical protein [Myxococcota bacterium]HRY96006.1 hypothetical protein [Myxococcota bacterium]HSA21690.1 hypothetical protein [Myxococcota bacterium]